MAETERTDLFEPESGGSEPVWIYPENDRAWVETIIHQYGIHPITAEILASRGYGDLDAIHSFLYAKLPDLHDPKLFLNMRKAIDVIATAISKGEGIMVYGDNDVDGITGTTLLVEFLTRIGGKAYYHIPGYKLKRQDQFVDAIPKAQELGCSVMITVDSGITSAREIQKVEAAGISVIITDHHEPTEKIPQCAAILNPKLPDQTYPHRELVGVGVAFKLAHGITNVMVSDKRLPPKKVDLKRYLDLVALGTVADMGVLHDENRILVRYGLAQLRKTKRTGLLKLYELCLLEKSEISTVDIATKIAPRLNSLGRVADPLKGVELLLVRPEEEAAKLAQELDLVNEKRQKIEQEVAADIAKRLEQEPKILEEKAIVLSSEKWHPGVIPILSARLCRQYTRPTVLVAIEEGLGKGSARTIREFPLLPALKKSADLFENYGGHNFAAGLTIQEKHIPQFTKRFLHAANSALGEHDITSKLFIDAEANFDALSYDLLSSLELFEPYGNENPPPLLFCEAVQTWSPKVIGNNHLKLYLEQGDRMLEGIAFGMAHRKKEIKKRNLRLRIAYTPQINRFHNKSSIQLLIRDFQVIE
ncbi:MAG: Single-stranded-DNA-specific exonuclease RecJ [Chlamydiales bacterium]|nr:Single-stranded-DNA-specific exonuclease RecJ [Chlamydiales bacterium]MCH9635966.1 Single-stranded-DNA-specific exonuclease RecJ [Chlamydiales bacterium]MCH9703843.1 single-stranded-DNA-specific exonuclease RecJ [Chlamydiota bacterium]